MRLVRRSISSGRARTTLLTNFLYIGVPTLKAQDVQRSTPPPGGEQLVSANLISGVEGLLPSEYFYCLAARASARKGTAIRTSSSRRRQTETESPRRTFWV
jgi:hypothetical protein